MELNLDMVVMLCWINTDCPTFSFFPPRENILDGTVVFTLLFGSELFEDYIGHLAMATMASSELTNDNDSPEKLQDRLKVSWLSKNNDLYLYWWYCSTSNFDVMLLVSLYFIVIKNVQREREEKLARFLKEFLSQYVRGDKEGFANRAEAEAKRLSSTSQSSDPSKRFLLFICSCKFNSLWMSICSIWVGYSSHHWIHLFSTSSKGAWQEGRVPRSAICGRVGEEQGPSVEVADHSSERWKTFFL